MNKRNKKMDLSLYLVLDPVLCGGLQGLVRTTQIAVRQGVTMVQLRAEAGWKKCQWFRAAQALKPILDEAGVPLIINDHIDVALAVDADGVHIGQKDLPVNIARALIGQDRYLGLSISNMHQIQAAPWDMIDYIGIGPVYPTVSKPDADPDLGLDYLRSLLEWKQCPAVAIGGINTERVVEVKQTGVEGIAVVSAICGQADTAQATRHLQQLVGGE